MTFIVGLCLIFCGGTAFGCGRRVGSGVVAEGPGGARFHNCADTATNILCTRFLNDSQQMVTMHNVHVVFWR